MRILAHTSVSFCTADALPIESLHQFVKQLYFPNPNNGSSPPISELMRLKELVQADVSDGKISWVSAEYVISDIEVASLNVLQSTGYIA